MPTKAAKPPVISPKRFADITRAIFTKGNDFTGVRIAAHMGQKQYQLWTAVNTKGLTANEARMFADGLDQWIVELLGMARKMRRLATELEGGTLPPMMPLSEARRAARPHVYGPKDESVEMVPGLTHRVVRQDNGDVSGAEIIGNDEPSSAGTVESAESGPDAGTDQPADTADLQIVPETTSVEAGDLVVSETEEPAKRTRFA